MTKVEPHRAALLYGAVLEFCSVWSGRNIWQCPFLHGLINLTSYISLVQSVLSRLVRPAPPAVSLVLSGSFYRALHPNIRKIYRKLFINPLTAESNNNPRSIARPGYI